LPDYLIETYRVLTSPIREEIHVFDVSDRPQYVGTVCRVISGTSTCHADSIFAIYSTEPTLSSSVPFTGRATAADGEADQYAGHHAALQPFVLGARW